MKKIRCLKHIQLDCLYKYKTKNYCGPSTVPLNLCSMRLSLAMYCSRFNLSFHFIAHSKLSLKNLNLLHVTLSCHCSSCRFVFHFFLFFSVSLSMLSINSFLYFIFRSLLLFIIAHSRTRVIYL